MAKVLIAKKWVDKHLQSSLKEILEETSQCLTTMERARVLVDIAKRMKVYPNNIVKVILEYR